MKITWEEKDIIPGREVSKTGDWPWRILVWELEEGRKLYLATDTVNNKVTSPMTREDLAKYLTCHGYLPIEFVTEPVVGQGERDNLETP